MKRRAGQEREEADAREQAEARREALLAELKAHEAAARAPEPLAAGEVSAAAADEPAPEDTPDEIVPTEGESA